MNVRKPIDYNPLHRELDALVTAGLPQVELYCEIGKLVSARPEKGAAVAAAEYLSKTYPDISGFSPRNLRRMRDFYRAYEGSPEILAEAMTIGWTRNAAILEGCESLEEQVWYIRAVRQFGWTKAKLLEKIHDGAYLENSLDVSVEKCYTETNFEACSSAAEWPARGSDCSRLTDQPHRTLSCNGQPSYADQRGGDNNTPSAVYEREGDIPIQLVRRHRDTLWNDAQYSFGQILTEQCEVWSAMAELTSDIRGDAVAKGSLPAKEKIKGDYTADFLPSKNIQIVGMFHTQPENR